MRRLLLIVRVGIAAFFVTFLAAALLGAAVAVQAALIALMWLCLFADASLSLAYPQLAKQAPEGSSLMRQLYQTSFFYDARATKGYSMAVVMLSGVLLI